MTTTIKIRVLVAERLKNQGGGHIGLVLNEGAAIDENFIKKNKLVYSQSFKDVREFELKIKEVEEWEKGDGLFGAGGFHFKNFIIENIEEIPEFMGIRKGVVDWFTATHRL